MYVDYFDYVLALILIFLTWQMLRVKDLLTSIVLFIIFGMLIALAWMQLKAPDIALVEAVIGSALTGVLFLGALGYIESKSQVVYVEKKNVLITSRVYTISLTILTAFLGFILFLTMWKLPEQQVGLHHHAMSALPESGVKNPVTAVILNFRGYDTLLEIGVLLLVVIAVFALNATRLVIINTSLKRKSRILAAFLYLLSPLMVLVGFYMLWAGGHAPGGAFQAGAMLAGVGILMLMGGGSLPLSMKFRVMRFIYAIGFASFICVGILVGNETRHFLQYPPSLAKYLIFMIEIFATISIAATLVTLFAGCTGLLLAQEDHVVKVKGKSL